MSDVLSYWVIVANGVVVATQDITVDPVALYGTSGTFNWFQYALPLITDHPTTTTVIRSLEDTPLLPNPASLTPSDPIGISVSSVPPPTPFVASATINRISRNASIPDPRLAMTLTNAQAAVVSEITSFYTHQVLATYPYQKQIDILRGGSGYSGSDITTMNTFINLQETTANQRITSVNALTSVAAVLAFNPFT